MKIHKPQIFTKTLIFSGCNYLWDKSTPEEKNNQALTALVKPTATKSQIKICTRGKYRLDSLFQVMQPKRRACRMGVSFSPSAFADSKL